MKWIGPAVLAAILALPGFAAAQNDVSDPHAVQLKQLDLEARQAELEFQRRMHGLELEARRAEIERLRTAPGRGQNGGALAILILGMIVVRALSTIWVYRDIEQYKASGLWIAIVLVGGLLALIAYVLVRLGNLQQARTGPA
ncbi:MAG: hypothetical protein IH624_01305 [Phycisphaerae bacterium]|nr:hypothetical protein [Phycisphaerae bacterium]